MKLLPINKGFLFIGVTVIFALALITYFPWEHSNYNGLPNSSLDMFLVNLYKFITYTSNFAFNNWALVNQNLVLYLLICLGNIFIYGLVVERIISYTLYKVKIK